MIFARRAVQKRIDFLRGAIGSSAVDDLVTRLNRPDKHRLAAMWEVVVLSSLAKCGALDHEIPLLSGRRPDIRFENEDIAFTADITCVSDSGLDEQNPYQELLRLVSAVKTKLGLPSGGLDLRVLSKDVVTRRGRRRVLRLPPKGRLAEFVRSEIMPSLRAQIAEGDAMLRVVIDDDDGPGIEITIKTNGSEFTTGSYAPYSSPTIKDRNPLYNALKSKADQIREADGITGVIVVDGDCAALSIDRVGRDTVPAEDIARELLRQCSSVDFVLMIAVRDEIGSFMPLQHIDSLRPILVTREADDRRSQLESVFSRMLSDFPKPVNSAVNGALRAKEVGYDLGNHGEYCMHGNKIRVSAREMMEVLAGVRTFDDGGALNISETGTKHGSKSEISSAFLNELMLGRLPARMSVIETDENESDQWIEFEFDNQDPAISPFR